eukprot:COSAG01_NODE_6592_length_3588_cov_10.651476_4_plen_92_part_00
MAPRLEAYTRTELGFEPWWTGEQNDTESVRAFRPKSLPVSMWCIHVGTYLIALSTVACLQTQSDEETSSAQLVFVVAAALYRADGWFEAAL